MHETFHPLAQVYPPDYQEWLFDAIGLRPGQEAMPAVLEPLFTLNHSWVNHDPSTTPPSDYTARAELLRSYTLYYMTINMPKLWFVLDRCQTLLARLREQKSWHLTELGCGPGTFLWAFLFYLRHHSPALLKTLRGIRGVDRAPLALRTAERLGADLKRWPQFAHLKVEFVQADWPTKIADETDVLLFGNTLGEQPGADWSWHTQLRAAVVLAIEPGTRAVFHHIRPWRDAMLAGGWSAHFPCTSAHACPMAADNWCHFEVNRQVLPFIQRMSSLAGRESAYHHFSAFVFSREGATPPNTWRALSHLRKAHRSGIRFLCDGEHLVETVLNRKERSDTNRAFLELEAGDAATFIPDPAVPSELLTSGRLRAGDTLTPVQL